MDNSDTQNQKSTTPIDEEYLWQVLELADGKEFLDFARSRGYKTCQSLVSEGYSFVSLGAQYLEDNFGSFEEFAREHKIFRLVFESWKEVSDTSQDADFWGTELSNALLDVSEWDASHRICSEIPYTHVEVEFRGINYVVNVEGGYQDRKYITNPNIGRRSIVTYDFGTNGRFMVDKQNSQVLHRI
jgi:hypothetical protein